MKIKLETVLHNDVIIDKKYPFLSSILFTNGETSKCIFDNIHTKLYSIYIFDKYDAKYNELLLKYALQWYKKGCTIPISVYFEQNNIKEYTKGLSKIVCAKYIVKIDGSVFHFPSTPTNCKKNSLKLGV